MDLLALPPSLCSVIAMNWLEPLVAGEPWYEQQVVDRYTFDLLKLARQRLPDGIRRRVDPEDVVQSVYRSFFRRLRNGEFAFDESHDVWRLLAVMTYHKVHNVTKYHRRQQRDASRDVSYETAAQPETAAALQASTPQPDDLAILQEYLEKLLAELPQRHHQLVILRLEGFSIAEIADQLNVSQRTVLRVLAQVRNLAKRLIGDET